MKIYYGKNANALWLIDNIRSRTYRTGTKRRRSRATPGHVRNITKQQSRYNTATMDAIEYIEDLPDLPLPLRRLTPGGRMYEIAKDLAIGLIILDPLDLIDDD